MEGSAAHWDGVYDRVPHDGVSWYEAEPTTSVRLITGAASPADPVIDVGAGTSRLADRLLELGWGDVTLLDVSATALAETESRLAAAGRSVQTVVTDLLAWQPERAVGVWHDRAVFHFLVEPHDQQRYVQVAADAVRPGGIAVLGVFAEDGPTQCSGLPTAQYDAGALAELFADAFVLERAEREQHETPGGVVQAFTWVVLRRS